MAGFKGEHKKLDQSIARLRKNGRNYEIIVDLETALKVREGKATAQEALLVDNIFKDAQKGDIAGEISKDFNTDDMLTVAEEIIKKGELQLTEEYRKKVTDAKKNEVIGEILKSASDPTTKLPVPRQRLELGIEKSAYKIRYEKSVADQVKELKELLPKFMPITFKDIMVTITSPAQFAGQAFGIAKKAGELVGQDYAPDGSVTVRIKALPGSIVELRDKLSTLSHGLIKIKEE